MTVKVLSRIAVVVVTGIFWLAVVGKLLDPYGLSAPLEEFGTPAVLVWPLTLAVLSLEAVVAVALLTKRHRHLALHIAGVLFLVFAAFNAIRLAAGGTSDCNCFGALWSRQLSWWIVGEDLAWAALVLFAISSSLSTRTATSSPPTSLPSDSGASKTSSRM